jgi:hypothetical protein
LKGSKTNTSVEQRTSGESFQRGFSAGHWTPDIVAMAGGENLLSRPGDRSRELSATSFANRDSKK